MFDFLVTYCHLVKDYIKTKNTILWKSWLFLTFVTILWKRRKSSVCSYSFKTINFAGALETVATVCFIDLFNPDKCLLHLWLSSSVSISVALDLCLEWKVQI